MATPEDVIRRYVDATSAADGDTAAALTADDAVIEVRDGVITRNQVFPSPDEAAAAAAD
jgi:hypothetical protein